ncbi:2'-5' RNA ligase family protein [Novosphingobium sp. 1949]|uniref:2'-5' RNA ligase family protein n=1 Tax=Novosphingobium organovorum TaxID=2930092 RepID=A0ABT0BE00_9SPHN|nr:2'-5' RNA ligase family protein [Novosphingobium organovorum]MCJ2183275.1 2'-5' RNA ligase family protein [Novosphingobium organovorum]
MTLRASLFTLFAGVAAAFAAPHAADAQESLSIDVYAIPSRTIVATVAGESKELAARGMTTFQAKGQAVHATLYLTRYPASAVPALKTAIAALARRQHRFPMAITGTERTASNWLFLTVERSAALQRLADEVTLAAEPLRDHAITAPAWMSHYPEKLPAFERYGSPNVFTQFEPHLTLLANETSPALDAYVEQTRAHPPQGTGLVEGIGIGLTDANGQIVRTLAEYRFAD